MLERKVYFWTQNTRLVNDNDLDTHLVRQIAESDATNANGKEKLNLKLPCRLNRINYSFLIFSTQLQKKIVFILTRPHQTNKV